ncbi:hypothetical protein SAMN05216223_112141 [Actinacidiphila yanglinensis]|uniref:Protein kinase domain-containing protein n=1 Tax=Actinacidiphila yanglinensis TaxID=310779 RepID=A0A1H6D6R9_9ACTN|nr:hypothetical protein [Actinacidiphila yanglinensis]SEG80992.1 hypothetical protein SAMN05216223_112141 [Actinacidiphila yanglinensis]
MRVASDPPGRSREARLTAYSSAATSLALCSDDRLGALVDAAAPLGTGIGGRSALLEVDGTQVFVKQLPLTDTERLPRHVRSTANLSGIPDLCHYGVGGPGFGAWRELAVQTMTTNWVLAGQYEGFPLMYHWRVLPGTPAELPAELADVAGMVAYWGGSQEVGRRIEEIRGATARMVLFLEYIPQTVHVWLADRIREGAESADRACSLVERELAAGTSFMNARGLLHFDAHFQNILADGRRLYFTDYGLALSSQFDLSPSEAGFFALHHRTYDPCYTRSWLVNRMITELYGYERKEREALIRACAQGEEPPDGPPGARAILIRHAPIAAMMTDFYGRVLDESREIPYPSEELLRALREDRSRHG